MVRTFIAAEHGRYVCFFLYGRKAVRFLCKAPEYLTIRECTVQQGKWKPSSQRRSILLTHGHATLSLVPSPRAAVWGLSHSSSNMMAASTSTTCKSKVSTKNHSTCTDVHSLK